MQDRPPDFTAEEEQMIRQIVDEMNATDDAKELANYKEKLKAAEQNIALLEKKLDQSEKEVNSLKSNISFSTLRQTEAELHRKQQFDLCEKLKMLEAENQNLRLELKRLNATIRDLQANEPKDQISISIADTGLRQRRKQKPLTPEAAPKKPSFFHDRVCSFLSAEEEESEATRSYRSCMSDDTCTIL